MADSKQPGKQTPPEERVPTQRVVLRREKVLVVPEGVVADVVKAAQEVIRKADKSAGSGVATEAWLVVGEFVGASKEDAIEAHTGPAGAPDTKVGTFKAPTVKAFAGGMRMVAPPKPLVQKEAID